MTIANGCTVTNRDAVAHDVASLTIQTNGVLTHTANSTTVAGELYKVILNVTNNLMIEAGGQINVDGKGYSAGEGPGGGGGANSAGGSYGGKGAPGWGGSGTPGLTYGSITAPTNLGSGGSSDGAPGGGAVRLIVAGTTTVFGAISASGGTNVNNAGSGGSVFLTTGMLTGNGTIKATGGIVTTADTGGGGRVAVVLTNSTDFGSVKVQAYAGDGSSSKGACGTIYLETRDQGPARGTLLIDANNIVPTFDKATTLISSNVIDRMVGTVVIANKAVLQIDTNQTLTVNGNWTNTATFIASGTVLFAGTNPATIYGSNMFYNLTCTNAGKILSFQTNTTTAIAAGGRLTLTGAIGNPITVQPASAGSNKLTLLPGSLQSLSYVAASNSDASAGDAVVVPTGTDLGGNLNWNFTGGQAVTWTGATSTNWFTDSNWSPKRPTYLDTVIIPNTATKPSLDASRVIAGLTNQSGAVLNLNGWNLTVSGPVTSAGAIVASTNETLTLNGDADFTGGTFTAKTSTVMLNGAGAQSFTPGGNVFYDITAANTNRAVTFQDGFTAHNLLLNGTNTFGGAFTANELRCTSPGSSLTFHNGSTYGVTRLTLAGAPGNLIKLQSSVPASAWNLNFGGAGYVYFVDVRDSNANPGKTVYTHNSTEIFGGNTNWDFGVWKTWAGGTSFDFTNALNWSGGVVPGPADRVLIDGAYVNAPRITVPTTVGLLNVGILNPSTLTVDSNLTVAGDATVGQYGVLTHTANSTSEIYKLILNVASNLTLEAGGQINVDGKGYGAGEGPGGGGGANSAGGSYGGKGAPGWSGSGTPGLTYGSITAPTNLGSGGSSDGAPGGGAVRLIVAGTTTVFGAISASGGTNVNNAGSGGSVFLTTGMLTGNGTIKANGGIATTADTGGGGRVAVVLTNSTDFGSVKVQAYAGDGSSSKGACGTVYLETRDQGPARGTLLIDANNIVPTFAKATTLISSNVIDRMVGTVVITNKAVLQIDTNQTLTVNGDWLINGGTFIGTNTGATVIFASTNTVTITGTNTFYNLTAGAAGKTILFEAGKTNAVNGMLIFQKGSTLLSTVDGVQWGLNLVSPGGTQQVGRVTVKDSNASLGQTIYAGNYSINLLNNVNWYFPRGGTILVVQ